LSAYSTHEGSVVSKAASPEEWVTPRARVRAEGKFLLVGNEKFYAKGVTYGTFRPDEDGVQFPAPETVERDFRAMAANGINSIRTYTTPPTWLFNAAQRHGLYVMVGLPWEQHVAFMDTPRLADEIEARVRMAVRKCGGHPAVLAYAIGNEIPVSIVRWHGAPRIEEFLQRLYRAVKSEAPDTLVTYVNFPTTEYLRLPFLDFCCFNVYLEEREKLQAYLAQLQNTAGDRPLVMAEIGLDSRRNGDVTQAETLDWQIRTVFEGGCAGTFVFAWTDEWYRGGFDIDDWDFGLTGRDRQPKSALTSVRSVFAEVPFPANTAWPRISVVVCTHNGVRTIGDTLEGLRKLDYPDYEVIVVDDGSTDHTAKIASQYAVHLIRTPNRGLSAARNTGMEAATGSIVAYIDDDAYPDPHWLQYLAWTFLTTSYRGVGGPNIPPAGDGKIAECVAHAPGGPVHVLLSAQEAEHIPGCNCAFRKECLQAVGGFDPIFRAAGDDVDLCWRLMERGWKLGFHPAAVVWHHRRNSVRTYWKQQKGYGKAEALLERKWPSKYNAAGHVTWAGRLYGKGVTQGLGRWRIYQGTWGSAAFQRIYQPEPGTVAWLPLMPEWYLVILAFAALVAMQVVWPPLRWAALPLAAAILAPMIYIVRTAVHEFNGMSWPCRLLTMGLHMAQPLARLWGRINHGLTPWRSRGLKKWANPLPKVSRLWSEHWHSSEDWLYAAERALGLQPAIVTRGGDFDDWDLEIRGGLLGGVHTRLAVEEHGGGKQLLRFRVWPKVSPTGIGIACMFWALAIGAGLQRDWSATAMLGGIGFLVAAWWLQGCSRAKAAFERALWKIGAQGI
jgi:GT2 family glycosyltransferase